MIKTSALQQAIEIVENLPPGDQEILLSLLQEIKEIRQEYSEGKVQFGSLDQFLTQLDQP